MVATSPGSDSPGSIAWPTIDLGCSQAKGRSVPWGAMGGAMGVDYSPVACIGLGRCWRR